MGRVPAGRGAALQGAAGRIPKDLAEFGFDGIRARARTPAGPLAAATVRPGLRLPGRWPVGFRVVQSLHSRPKTSRVRATARLSLGRSAWTIPADGPLGYLAGRRPSLTLTLANFRMEFGGAAAPAAP